MGFKKVRVAATIGAVTALLVAAAPADTRAAEADSPPRVQLPSFMAPVVKPDGAHGMVPMTLVLHVGSAGDVKKLCGLLPVVQDAVMQALYAHQIHQSANGKLDVTGLQERLIDATNKSLSAKVVQNAEVYEGLLKTGSGGAKFAGWQMCRDVSKSRASE